MSDNAMNGTGEPVVELHAMTTRDTISLDTEHKLDETGAPLPGAEVAVKQLLDQLQRWARALREARHARPYRP